MKKSIILLMVVSLLLVGCGKQSDEKKEKTTSQVTTTTESTTTTTTSTTTTKKKTTKATTTAKKLGKNEYISTVDGKVHKYSFVYADKATCEDKARGDVPYDTVFPVKPYAVLGCEEAKDLSGKSFWGIIFYEQAGKEYKFYY